MFCSVLVDGHSAGEKLNEEHAEAEDVALGGEEVEAVVFGSR